MIVERHEIAIILVFLCVYIDIEVMCMYKRGSQNSCMFLWLYKGLQIHVLNVSSPSTQPYHGLCLLAASGGSGCLKVATAGVGLAQGSLHLSEGAEMGSLEGLCMVFAPATS